MQPLQPDTSYHIFNRANGFENVFRTEENFRYFLEKVRLYISPIAETYAYCLMPNHFHLVVRIRKREVIVANNFSKVRVSNHRSNNDLKPFNEQNFNNFSKVRGSNHRSNNDLKPFNEQNTENFGKVKVEIDISDREIEKFLSKQFANLFSCYTQSFNKVYRRMGSLFIKNFKRQPISDKSYFLNAIVYTHRNPVHHGFCSNYEEWEYSSYNEIVDGVCDLIEINKLIKMTDGLESFKELHRIGLKNFENPYDLETPITHD